MITNCKNCSAPLATLPTCDYCHTVYLNVTSDIPVTWFYDARYLSIEQARHFGNPRKIIPVNVPEGMSLGDIVGAIPVGEKVIERNE